MASGAESDSVADDRAYGERDREPAQEYDRYLGCPAHALIIGRSPRWLLSPNGVFGAVARSAFYPLERRWSRLF